MGRYPRDLRAPMGNRIYGCDDCQLVCPWNKYARKSSLPDFDARPAVAEAGLLQAFGWTQEDFERHTEGSAIRRIGHERWQRNVAVAMGNALRAAPPAAPELRAALASGRDAATPLVREHIDWALAQGGGKSS